MVNWTLMTSRRSLYSLLFAIFNDAFASGIILTVLAPIFSQQGNQFFSKSTSLEIQGIVFGVLLGCYSLAHLVVAPIIGALADRYGRKRVLTWSLLCTGLGFLLTAIALQT